MKTKLLNGRREQKKESLHWIPESGHSRRVILLRGRLSNGEKTISEEFTDCATSWINCRASGPRRKSDTGRKRYTMKRAARRIRKKIRDLVDEMHKKFTKWIVEQYHTVLLPEFETKRMVKRANRRIGSKTARAMLGWSHYRFKQRLLNKTREYPWCKVVICDEHFTSKTCGNCGFLHQKLGSNKTFKCPQCHVEMDRDINAARNILLRYLTILNRAGSFKEDPVLGLTPSIIVN